MFERLTVLWAGFVRLLYVCRVLLRHGVAHLLAPRLASWPRLARLFAARELSGPERLRVLFEDLGGTFVKFGQMLALQPDILSLEYCNALFKLLDKVDPFSYSEVERIVVEELGQRPEEIFDSIDREPLATASVGQVHVAYLEGQKVAVKVQRPNVEAEFWSDIRLMMFGMRTIRGLRLKPIYWMLEPMDEFVGWTQEELDYRNEARYAEELRRHPLDSSKQYVPQVFTRYSTRRVLVVEFLDGITLLDYLRARDRGDEVSIKRLEAKGFDRKRFAANVIDNFLGNAFLHGLYHADLHPANLMILDNSVVGYIDFGITGLMSPYSRRHLVAMTLALAQGDLNMLCGEFLKLSRLSDGADVEDFQAAMKKLTIDWYEERGTQKRLRVSFTQVMTDMLELSRQTGVMPERDIIKYIRSAIAIDGLNSRFEPDFHVGEHLQQTCGRFLRWQELGSVFTNENLSAWSGSAARLLAGGVSRSGKLLDQWLEGDTPIAVSMESRDEESGRLRTRALHLSVFVLLLALLLSFNDERVALGFNLFTAEVVLAVAGLATLLPTLQRLA